MQRTFNAETVKVETHSADRGRPYLPAVNVKVYRGFESVTPEQWASIRATAGDYEASIPEAVLATFGADWIEARFDLSKSGPRSQAFYETWYSEACTAGFEEAEEDAKALFGSDVKCYSAGRMGGWLVVQGLPEVEDWRRVKAGEECPHCGKPFSAEDEEDQACDGAPERGGCGESYAPFLPSLKGSRVEGASFEDGTKLSENADIFERWAFFEEVCKRLAAETPMRCADLIAVNVFAREEALREVEFLRALDGGRWDTVRARVPHKLEDDEAVGYLESSRPELVPDFAHVFVLRDPAPKVTVEELEAD